MTKRIFRSIFGVALAVLLASLALIMGVLYEYFTAQYGNELKNEAVYIAQGIEEEGGAYLDALEFPTGSRTRVTWIDGEGTVLFDSMADPATMENHAQREEVQSALETGTGESLRYSSTLSEQTVNYAVRLEDGTVLRLSGGQLSVWMLVLNMLQPILTVLVIAVALSGFLAYRVSRRVVEPLNHMDLEHPLENEGAYDELAPFLTRIDRQNKQIRAQMEALRARQQEFDTITAQMDEGLVMLNRSSDILFINRRGAEIFDVDGDCVGRHIFSLNRSAQVMPVLEKALGGAEAETRLEIRGRTYQFLATPVKSGADQQGVVILILDVTQSDQAEQMRREFSANVSHELKTPLTSITGYAELMANGLVRQEDMAPFAGKIYQEAKRLIALVEDIIRLSRLDEGAGSFQKEPVSLLELARTVAARLEPLAAERSVTVTVTGGEERVQGVPHILDEIIYNLCENAIKYNRPGGTVDVSVTRAGGRAVLAVADTGIGIPQAHQGRVFERFYRVDKSHSKATGGTGLGLSIVKHGAMLHNAELTLESREGAGTTVRLTFPAD